MTDSELLARWQGWKPISPNIIGKYWRNGDECIITLPDYPNDAVACDSLLDTLVEKGYCPVLGLNGTTNLWQCDIDEFFMRGKIRLHSPVITEIGANTRREAIIAACLEVARKEQENGTR